MAAAENVHSRVDAARVGKRALPRIRLRAVVDGVDEEAHELGVVVIPLQHGVAVQGCAMTGALLVAVIPFISESEISAQAQARVLAYFDLRPRRCRRHRPQCQQVNQYAHLVFMTAQNSLALPLNRPIPDGLTSAI